MEGINTIQFKDSETLDRYRMALVEAHAILVVLMRNGNHFADQIKDIESDLYELASKINLSRLSKEML